MLKKKNSWEIITKIADENFIAVGNVIADDQGKDCSEKLRETLIQKVSKNKQEGSMKDRYNIWLRYIDCRKGDVPKTSIISNFQ